MNQQNKTYRIRKYLLFASIGVVFIIIISNMVFISYQDCINLLGNTIYLICFTLLLLYGIAVWFNYSVLVPRLLLKNKYPAYFLILFAIGFALPIVAIAQEYWVRTSLGLPHRISSYTNPLIVVDSIASSMMIFICFFGFPIIAFLRQWMIKKEQVSMMEYKHLKSEINKLKGQVAPVFLSRTLMKAETFVQSNPSKTSEILIKLAQLLRYQLYDCDRDKVLLKSEITFLTNFLNLERLNRDPFQYHIFTDDHLNNILVSPMLFIGIAQSMIQDSSYLELSFRMDGEILTFVCQSDNEKVPVESELYQVKKSLELQYAGRHTLSVGKGIVKLQLNIPE